MLREVDTAVIDHDGVRQHSRPGETRPAGPAGLHDQRSGHPVVRPGRLRRPFRRRLGRAENLEQHRGDIHALGRHRSQPQAEDAPREQVHRDRQLGLHPAQSDRFHREHVQRGAVQQDVLARPRRPQPPVTRLRAVSDRPAGLSAPGEAAPSPAQLIQRPVSGSALWRGHAARAEITVQPGPHPAQRQALGHAGLLDLLLQHRPAGISPPRVHSLQRIPDP